ncbi:hypothetical protein GJV06_04205 [Enterobacteriaceae bacterium RIT691]|nr:hypothetical protein [Enterobacteriaceae bacterium RIT691]
MVTKLKSAAPQQKKSTGMAPKVKKTGKKHNDVIEKKKQIAGISEDTEKVAIRRKNVGYQHTRQEKLNQLGTHKITARLNDADYEKLGDLIEYMNHPRPEKNKHQVIERYSMLLSYMLRKAHKLRILSPESERAKELYRLHKLVRDLKYNKTHTNSEIIEIMKKDKEPTPESVINDDTNHNWNDNDIKDILNIKKVKLNIKELE